MCRTAAVKYHQHMDTLPPSVDVVMLGTFSTWRLGTIQARALPFATSLAELGVRAAIVTTPWDAPAEAGVVDVAGGIPVINTDSVSTRLPVRAIRQQVEWVRRFNPAVVHVLKPRGFGGLAARMLERSYPIVVDSDDWEGDGGWNDSGNYPWLQQRVFHHQELDLLTRAGHVSAASTLLAQRARQLRPRREHSVHQIENGLTAERVQTMAAARAIRQSEVDPPVVVLYSRFAEFEDTWLQRFVTALRSRGTTSLTVRVIGRDRIPADPPAIDGSITLDLMGYVASQDVPALLGSTTVAVYPYQDSLITRAKQSVKLLELMAAGCPIIASDVGDVAGTLGAGGRILQSADPVSFATEVCDLLECPTHLNEMSALAMARIRDRYTFSALAPRMLALYQQAGL